MEERGGERREGRGEVEIEDRETWRKKKNGNDEVERR